MFTWLGNNYNYTTRISLILLYFLILAGGVVRCTGSGMGCPDWPKCFGKLIPPTSVEGLPNDYEKSFVDGRIEKNKRLSKVLSFIGFKETSNKIINDPEIRKAEKFNVFKTWTEYINRLIGALVGVSLLLTFFSSAILRPFNKKLFLFSLISIVLVFFQAWVGSIVVSTNLLPGLITFHVIVALVIICNVIFCFHLSSSRNYKIQKSPILNFFILTGFILFFIQIVLGTEVRESVDSFFKLFGFENRELIIESLDNNFKIHRSFSLLILLFQCVTCYLIFKQSKLDPLLKNISLILLIFIVLEIGVGAGMAYFQIPKFLQPIHLLIAFLIFGLQFYVILINNSFKSIKRI